MKGYCSCILKSGPRRGSACGVNLASGQEYCGRHKNCHDKTPKKKVHKKRRDTSIEKTITLQTFIDIPSVYKKKIKPFLAKQDIYSKDAVPRTLKYINSVFTPEEMSRDRKSIKRYLEFLIGSLQHKQTDAGWKNLIRDIVIHSNPDDSMKQQIEKAKLHLGEQTVSDYLYLIKYIIAITAMHKNKILEGTDCKQCLRKIKILSL